MGNERETIIAIMKANALNAYLATCEGDEPRLRPISPIITDDMAIWIATYDCSRKAAQIRCNPHICLAFIEMPDGEKSVTVYGDAEIVADLELKIKIWEISPYDLAKYFPEGPSSTDYCLLHINVKKIEWRDSWTSELQVYLPQC